MSNRAWTYVTIACICLLIVTLALITNFWLPA